MTFLQRLKNERIGYVSAIIAAMLFGSISTITKPVLEDLNALLVSSLTYIIAGLSLIPFLKFSFTNSNSNSNSNSNNTLETTNNTSKKRKWTDNRKSYFLLYLQVFVEQL
jgi:beta-lactamase regulating signal transducer with metallopeptidase domain